MNKKEIIPIIGVSLLLLFYPVTILFQIWLPVVYLFYIISFVLVVWLVYNIVFYGGQRDRELNQNEE